METTEKRARGATPTQEEGSVKFVTDLTVSIDCEIDLVAKLIMELAASKRDVASEDLPPLLSLSENTEGFLSIPAEFLAPTPFSTPAASYEEEPKAVSPAVESDESRSYIPQKPKEVQKCPREDIPIVKEDMKWSYHLCGRGCPGHDWVFVREEQSGKEKLHYWVNQHMKKHRGGKWMKIRGHYRLTK